MEKVSRLLPLGALLESGRVPVSESWNKSSSLGAVMRSYAYCYFRHQSVMPSDIPMVEICEKCRPAHGPKVSW